MATDSSASGEVPASDYQTLPRVSTRIDPAVKVAPSCMMWLIVIGLGLLVATILMWALSTGTRLIDWSLLFH